MNDEEVEALLEKAQDPARYVSAEVLQAELDATKARVAQARKARQPTDDLEMRAEMLQSGLDMLQLKCDMGSLTPEQYAATVKGAIVKERQLAKELSRAGQKPAALDCLRRAKIMEAELAEME